MYKMTEQDKQEFILLHKTMEEFQPRAGGPGNAPVFGEIPANRPMHSR